MEIRSIRSIEDLVRYFAENLEWKIDLDDFEDIEDITYDFEAKDIGLKEEAFSKIRSLRQLRPLCDEQQWGIFCVEFESNRFEVTALRKILSGLIPRRRNSAEHAVWDQKDLLFLCFWGQDNDRTIGVAHFEDVETGLPQIKMNSCAPAIEDGAVIQVFENRLKHLKWVQDVTDTQAWYEQWSKAFVVGYREVIRTAQMLTQELAKAAQYIRGQILKIYEVETDDGYVHMLHKDFQDNLISDMTKEQFADMYAQTVVYGIFSARCMDKTPGDFNVREAVECIPNTNPFLKRLMKECLDGGSDKQLTFDELEVSNIVDILMHTDTELILADFNRQAHEGSEDPVIYFYEGFLNQYDPEQRVQRGVYYTPQPVVNFIVRAVDSILKTEFGLADGLASEETKTVKYMRDSKIKVNGFITQIEDTKEVPAVQILDPATGTGTFLRLTILQIYDNFKAKHNGESEEQIRKAWNEYVPKHLLPRLNGFELMMAPYAVAHMKLAMVLKDTGYDFGGDHRLNVFLTNSLEEAGRDDLQLTLDGSDPLAVESVEANQAKKNNGINVIIGNPPYSGISSNNNTFITKLIEDYKYIDCKHFNERKHWLNDDYVKFIRYAQSLIERTGSGILAYICPHGFLDNPTFRAMRWNLLQTFDKIYVLNLHGNINRGERCPDGSKDENIFDIEQGVSINILIKTNRNSHSVLYHDVYGLRSNKNDLLQATLLGEIDWQEVIPQAPYYLFRHGVIQNDDYQGDSFFSIEELFDKHSVGFVTANDILNISFSKEEQKAKLQDLLSMDEKAWREKYSRITDSRDWRYLNAKTDASNASDSKIVICAYRPFDFRYTCYTGNSRGLYSSPQRNIMENMLRDNYALITAKSNKSDNCSHFYISDKITEAKCGESTTQSATFPLYYYHKECGKEYRDSNLNSQIINKISEILNLSFETKNDDNTFSALNILDYVYSILYSSKFRYKYNDDLKMGFPRIPYPTDQETFWKLVEIGSKLRECHLMHTDFDITSYSFIGDGTNEVVKPEYKNGRVYISKTQYFDNVPQAQWEQYIGGYQPLQKWLKDRKKTTLSAEDIEHYKKIIAALKLTEELMAEIDQVVEF